MRAHESSQRQCPRLAGPFGITERPLVQAGLFAVALASLELAGCATASLDLERARRHYLDHDHFAALSLLRLLTDDLDALEPAERVQWAYLRGMTDRRIGDSLPRHRAEERRRFHACSRDWLERALSVPTDEGGLSSDEQRMARDALDTTPATGLAPGLCASPERAANAAWTEPRTRVTSNP
jgi:hypothetical protein